jgi:hypothetical protein
MGDDPRTADPRPGTIRTVHTATCVHCRGEIVRTTGKPWHHTYNGKLQCHPDNLRAAPVRAAAEQRFWRRRRDRQGR